MPSMTDEIALDTTIHEPSMTAGEVEMLLFALERSRAPFAWKVGGLDAAGTAPAPPAVNDDAGGPDQAPRPLSRTTVDRRVRHRRAVGPAVGRGRGRRRSWEWCWRSAADDSPEELYALWSGAVERSRAALAAALADGGLDQPSKFVLRSGESPNLRRLLVDLHDEYARHVGHADLFREAVDGLVGEDPP